MLYLKIDIEQNKENYQAVVNALKEFDIVSVSWEDGTNIGVGAISSEEPKELQDKLSAAVDKVKKRQSAF